ncbi:MAG: DMT family transporter [Eubacterium sp.]|nr:DMT family transporter [Eubacterium sp.]
MNDTKKKNPGHCALLFLAAVIWGAAFVAQSAGMEKVGPFTFSTIRFFLGSLVLIPVLTFRMKRRVVSDIAGDATVTLNGTDSNQSFRKNLRTTGKAGLVCGCILAVAANLQQIAMLDAPAGKAGFLTALYIVLVPIVGIFMKKKTSVLTWCGVFLAVIGLYFLCIGWGGEFLFQASDLLLLGCALVFSFHIIAVDHFNEKGADGIGLSCVQFFTAGVLSLPGMLLLDSNVFHKAVSFTAIWDAKWPILYAGVLSCGVAYTLQVIGQKDVHPTLASMIMSLESVTSVIAGFLILSQKLTSDELIGCGLMFAAIVLAQIPVRSKSES